jgi:protocatechuate 3,4-dioxygenase beta subunit
MQRGWRAILIVLGIVGAASCARAESGAESPAESSAARSREPVVGLPCEGCEAVFVGMLATLAAQARIAPVGEPGEPLVIRGTVFTAAGRPAAGVIVYAYQTDARGLYPPEPGASGRPSVRHGRLRGWARTDAAGEYRFDTIRPAGYPGTGIPQHVHMHVIEPARCTYYVDDLLFEDDPRLTAAQRANHDHGRGGRGIAVPTKGSDGIWSVRRDIRLGENIPGYPAIP